MSTLKKRINISLPTQATTTLDEIAQRDHMPIATKASALLQLALEIEEDDVLNRMAEERDVKQAKFVAHQAAW